MLKEKDIKETRIRKAGKAVAKILRQLKESAQIGSSGTQLDKIARRIMQEEGVSSSSLGYNGFPGAICVSVNEQLTHGVPSDYKFKNGDLISLDVACQYKGYHADAALTFVLGESNQEKDNLLRVTKNSLEYVIRSIVPNVTTTREIGSMIERYVTSRGYQVIREYGGHGIGQKMHEEPFIPNFRGGKNIVIKEGSFICIEPLVQIGDNIIEVSAVDNWTVYSPTKKLNAHFEHTIFVGKDKAEILTEY